WVLVGLDDHGELHGRVAHLDRGFGVGKLSAIHDIGPLDEFLHRVRIEAEALLGDGRQELGAGLEVRIVELAAAGVLLEVGGIFGSEKGALMMIEPPSDLRGSGVFEINDGIFVAIELSLIEKRAGAVHQAAKAKLDVFADALAVKAGKQSRG